MAQTVEFHSRKHKALTSNISIIQKRKKKGGKKTEDAQTDMCELAGLTLEMMHP
jgi:hypothetical protein